MYTKYAWIQCFLRQCNSNKINHWWQQEVLHHCPFSLKTLRGTYEAHISVVVTHYREMSIRAENSSSSLSI